MDIKKNNFFNLLDIVEEHENWMKETINLIASENLLSPLVAEVLKSDLGNRVAEGWIGERFFAGTKYYDEIEKYGMDLASAMFKADFVDVRPISGTMANMIIYNAFTKPGDIIASISISSGAHISMAGSAPKKVFGLNFIELPFDYENFNLDKEKSLNIIKKYKPKIVVLGGSVLLFKQPIKEIAIACKEVGAILLFDGSHVAGLISSGLYPNPLEEGADILTMTVCKTIPGPQHAIICSKDEFAEKIKRTSFPNFMSSHHLNETVAGILALEEFKVFGEDYSRQVLLNSRILAENLSNMGFKVLAKNKGFTETHMCLLDISPQLPAEEAEKLLEDVNIIVNRNFLPVANSKFVGIRIGTPEITRIGAREKDMVQVATFFKRLFIEKDDPKKIKADVINFRKSFKNIEFCYKKIL